MWPAATYATGRRQKFRCQVSILGPLGYEPNALTSAPHRRDASVSGGTHSTISMAGLEPATFGLEVQRSIH